MIDYLHFTHNTEQANAIYFIFKIWNLMATGIHANWINNLFFSSNYENIDEFIEVEENDNSSQSEDQQKFACLFRKFIILGAKT
jgi:hypothetical protein